MQIFLAYKTVCKSDCQTSVHFDLFLTLQNNLKGVKNCALCVTLICEFQKPIDLAKTDRKVM
uniref:Uncharacterized protein n=1 Tax=Romanomermis culicivorax TaxID=13658 RepID=A0A915KZZ8_ROMCU